MFKVGDVVECLVDCEGQFTKGKEYRVRSSGADIVKVERDDSGSPNGWMNEYFRLAEPCKSPVRTVTRREIVPGRYGMVEVGQTELHGDLRVAIRVANRIQGMRVSTSEDLREAAHLLNQLAEVLEENK